MAANSAQASFQRLAVGAGIGAGVVTVVTRLVAGLVADWVTGLLGDARSVCVKRTPFGIDPFRRAATCWAYSALARPALTRKVFATGGRDAVSECAAAHAAVERPRSAGPGMVAEAAASHKRSLSETARTVKIDPRTGDVVD